MIPRKLLECASKVFNEDIFPMAVGMDPEKLFELSVRYVSKDSCPKYEGIVPRKLFMLRVSRDIATALPRNDGSVPVSLLVSSCRAFSRVNTDQEAGIEPPNRLLRKRKNCSDVELDSCGSEPVR